MRAVVGTAGHVDHGKTTLVTHLTGIETDRLKEEKARGISIELGFAWLDLEEGRVAIVDVPGHERFVRQMIAGAAGMDLVLLVVAADEGVMPQTREHLDICQLLGVRAGGIVVTKVDLVDDEWLDLVVDDLRETVRGTFLDGAPLTTYAAGDEDARNRVCRLVEELVVKAELTGGLAARSEDRPFKLSVDRGFTMRGFGTVVTGTTASGTLAVGDPVVVLPEGLRGRVRGLQQHGEVADRIGPGVRAAVNLQGIDHDQVHRGDVLARADTLPVTTLLDGEFRALARLEEPIEDRTSVLVHVGTAQIEGTLVLMGPRSVAPGEVVPVQIRLATPVAVLPGEPYVLRGFTVLTGYGKTLGGGRVLTPVQRRYRRSNPAEPALVRALAGTDPTAMLAELLRFEAEEGAARASLPSRLPLEGKEIEATLAALLERGDVVDAGGVLHHRDVLEELGGAVEERLDEHHRAAPARPGMAVEELRTRLREHLRPELLAVALDHLVRRGRVRRFTEGRGDLVALADFQPRRTEAQIDACAKVRDVLVRGGLAPARVPDLPDEVGLPHSVVEDALDLLAADGEVVRVSQDLYFAAGPLEDLRVRLVEYLGSHGTIDTGAFKDLTGASRKWTIPLGEYFDRVRVTLRVGDLRRLRQ